MTTAVTLLLDGAVSDAQAAGFLVGLRARGETIEEITAAARVMRKKALAVSAPEDAVDTCGTGGDGQGTFNISTAAAIVAAGCGVPIAKHGNKAASSRSGSSDVLTALGVNIHATPAMITRCIEEAGVGFMFAAAHHQAVANVAKVRSALGVRTLFNMLGPLTNPAGAKRQLMGVFAQDRVEPLAGVLLSLGAKRAWVVHGEDGLDEITTTGETMVASIEDGTISVFRIAPEDVGLKRASADDLKGGSPVDNARAIEDVLSGAQGAFRDIVVLNAGAAALVGEKVETLREGVEMAAHAIDSGGAARALQTLIRLSQPDADEQSQ